MNDIELPARLPAPEHEAHLLGAATERPHHPSLSGDRMHVLAGAACWVGSMLGVAWISEWLAKGGTGGRDEGRTR